MLTINNLLFTTFNFYLQFPILFCECFSDSSLLSTYSRATKSIAKAFNQTLTMITNYLFEIKNFIGLRFTRATSGKRTRIFCKAFSNQTPNFMKLFVGENSSTVNIILLSTFFLIVFVGHSQTGPGGVGNESGIAGQPRNIVWLDAFSLGLTNGFPVGNWTDRSGNGFNATRGVASQQPDFISSVLNGRPIIRFDGVDDALSLDTSINTNPDGIVNRDYSFIVVGARRTSTSNDGWLLYGDGAFDARSNLYVGWRGGDPSNFRFSQFGATELQVNSPNYLNNGVNQYAIFTGTFGQAVTPPRSLYENAYRIGTNPNSQTLLSYTGAELGGILGTNECAVDIAEVIFYQGSLNTSQVIIINNYLNAKYNLSLIGFDGVDRDFYDGDTPANGDFDYDVIGIGQDNGTRHTNTNSTGFILSAGTGLDADGEFLFAGHDNTPHGISMNSLPIGVQERWSRSWYIDKTGTLDGSITFDLNEIFPGELFGGAKDDYVLLRYNGSAFQEVAINDLNKVADGGLISFNFNDTDISNGRYTIGTKNTTSSPLTPKDTDLDGISDLNDLDDDNDGILDSAENCNYTENFNDRNLNSFMEESASNSSPEVVISYANNDARFTHPTASTRTRKYIRTVDNSFYDKSVRFAVTATMPNSTSPGGTPFVGFGPGIASTSYFGEPEHPILGVNIRPDINRLYFHDKQPGDSYTTGNSENLPDVRNTIVRFRFTWNADSKRVLIEVDNNYNGTFVTDYSRVFDGSNNGFTASNMRVYFGGGNGIRFDNFEMEVECDEDGDGIPNSKDLDTDNDGIYDTEEAGHDQLHTNGQVVAPVGTDGIPDSVQGAGNADAGTVDYSIRDDNTTGRPNYKNLDSDGDGCSDANEAYEDPTADGGDSGTYGSDPAAVDADGRVVAASYTASDYLNATVIGPDTDGDGIYDGCDPVFNDNDMDGVSNNIDLDDDNDGIFDTDECGSSEGTLTLTGDFSASETGPGPLSASAFNAGGVSGSSGTIASGFMTNDIQLSANISGSVAAGSVLNGCTLRVNIGRMDDGVKVLLDGVTVLNFNQTHFNGDPEFNATGRFNIDGNGGWNPWTGEGNIELVITTNRIQLLLDTNSGTREDALPYMKRSSGTGENRFIYNPMPFDCTTGVDFDIFNANQAFGSRLQDVTLTATLEMCADSDSDGEADKFELDSDNDGCYDTVEAGFTDSDGDGILGTSPIVVNTEGVVTGQGGYTQPADINNNSIYDFQEGTSIAPIIVNCPTDIVLVNNDPDQCGAIATWIPPTATDNCGNPLIESNGYVPGDSFLPGVTTVIYTVTGNDGGVSTCSFTVTVNDNVDPVIIGPSDIIASNDNGACEAIVSYPLPTATDNCPPGDGTNPIFSDFEVANRDALIAECWQFFGSAVSTNLPLSSTTSFRTSNLISTESRGLISPLAYFNGTGQISFQHKIDRARFNNRLTVSLVDEADVSTIIFDEVYTDNSLLFQTIEITQIGNFRVKFDFNTDTNATDRGRLDNLLIPALKITALGSGACPAATLQVIQTAGLPSGSSFPVGITTNTFEVADASGNIATYSFNITVSDDENPTASAPAPITVQCGFEIPAPDPMVVTDATDNCTADPVVAFVSDTSDGNSNPETITRTYSVTDDAGNNALIEQLITVQGSAPDISIGDIIGVEGSILEFTMTLSEPSCSAIEMILSFTDDTADASDYDNASVTIIIPSGSTSIIIPVTTFDDTLSEGDETFTISIDSVLSGVLGNISDTGIGIIIDNDLQDIDRDDDGIVDSFEDLNLDADNDPSTNPTDTDNDGFPDYLDIDSDGDGIPDNVEAQPTEAYMAPSGTDSNANGLDDAYETNGELGLFPIDTDGDSMPDFLDTDTDDDGVPDAIEGHDQNRDGIPDRGPIGSDKDDDGLDDGYEGAIMVDFDVNDEIENPFIDLPNTDGDNESDYRDTDDDNDGIETINEDINNDMDYSNDDSDSDGIPDYLDPDITGQDLENGVEVFNVVTPNGDGFYDELEITGLENFQENSLRIFNRWGKEIYYTENYGAVGNTFRGDSEATMTVGQRNGLPTGTYFYILNYSDGTEPKNQLSGYIYINR